MAFFKFLLIDKNTTKPINILYSNKVKGCFTLNKKLKKYLSNKIALFYLILYFA